MGSYHLDLHMGWDRFEKLVLDLSRGLLGISHLMLRRYGTQGQTQYGIDIAGREPDGQYTVIQCKEYRVFTETNLRKAVETFANGKRPFGARKFVVAVSSGTQGTQLFDELEDLRHEHPDLALDLWGSEQLNKEMRRRPEVVAQFWTRATAEEFCTDAPLPAAPLPAADRMQQAQQILVGPLQTDEVAPRLRDAEEKMTMQPIEAATIYGAIAVELNAAGHRSYAFVAHSKQLEALASAGAVDDAVALAGLLAAVNLHHGDDNAAGLHQRWLETQAGTGFGAMVGGTKSTVVSPETLRHAALIEAAVEAYRDVLGAIEQLFEVLSDTSSGVAAPHYQPLLVLQLAEAMLIDTPEQLSALDNLIKEALRQITARPIDDVPNGISIRLRLVLAEYDDNEHKSLLREAHRHALKPAHAALVHAREARRCSLGERPVDALDHWLDAVHEGIHASLTEDAAAWLYSIQRLRSLYTVEGPVDEHRLAQSLRASAGQRLIPRYHNVREIALSAFAANQARAAVIATRRWLVDSIVTGRWADEAAALQFLGDLYRANGEPSRAARYYQRAGSTDKLSELTRQVGDQLLPFGPLNDAPWWVLQARFQVLTEQSDHLSDETAAALLGELTDLASQRRAEAPKHPLTLPITAAVCALAVRGTVAQAQAVLDLLASDVSRPPGHFRHTDRVHAKAIGEIARYYPELAFASVTRLLELADGDADDAIGELLDPDILTILGAEQTDGPTDFAAKPHLSALTEEEREKVKHRVEALVDRKRHLSAELLQMIEPSHPALRARGEEARAQILSRPEPDPNHADSGTPLIPHAVRVRALAPDEQAACLEKVLSVAHDTRETAENRQDALVSARYLIESQPVEVHTEAFVQSLSFVRGDQDGSAFDGLINGQSHPLSSVQLNLGTPSLRGAGLRLAFASAQTQEEYIAVRDNAFALLSSAEDSDVNMAAHMLHNLPREITDGIEPALLSAHKNRAVRKLAAVLSVRRLGECEATALRLAHDPVVWVRGALARELAGVSEPAELVAQLKRLLRTDIRHSVRREIGKLV